MNTLSVVELLGAVFFSVAILHTFSIKRFQHLALRYPEGSILENLFHLLGDVEIVFGLWAGILILALTFLWGKEATIEHLETLNFTEPLFVFVIMTTASTKPVLNLAKTLIDGMSRWIPLNKESSFLFVALSLGSLLGSFITEPAAMTVTAFLLRDRFFERAVSDRFKYSVLAALFVNISIGGTLTPYAAPPVLMVSSKWGWDLGFMMAHFGGKAILAVLVNSLCLALFFSKELATLPELNKSASKTQPWWITAIHLLFLGLIVACSHHPIIFVGFFLFFLGLVSITQEYQEELKMKESLLVSFFLGGLVVLGSFQRWWLEPLLQGLNESSLYFGSTLLTAVLDNAALTYLGSQVPNITDGFKYALVAGAVSGGGLTVIANAPNPAGFSILRGSFGKEGISPTKLFLYATLPTLVVIICFWVIK